MKMKIEKIYTFNEEDIKEAAEEFLERKHDVYESPTSIELYINEKAGKGERVSVVVTIHSDE